MKLGPLIKISAQRISEVVDGDPPFYVCKCKSKRERERERAWALESVGVIGNERGDYIERRKEREGES